MNVRQISSTLALCLAAMLCIGNSVQAEEIIVPALKETASLILNYRDGKESRQVHIRPQDEIWLVCARNSHSQPTDLSRLSVKKLSGGVWQNSLLNDLVTSHQTDQTRSTVLHVHGWRTNHEASIRQTMDIYKNVTTKRRCTQPLRWILWQWKSDKDNPRFRTDYIEKSKLALTISTTLSSTLAQFGDRNITLLGHSLGNTVILSAMLKPTMLPETETGYRLAIVGAAIGCEFAHNLSRHRFVAISQIDQTVIINNRHDPILSLGNQLICRQSYGRKRLDLASIVAQRRIALGNVRWHEASGEIGRRHDGKYYTASNTFLSEFSRLLTPTHADIKTASGRDLSDQSLKQRTR